MRGIRRNKLFILILSMQVHPSLSTQLPTRSNGPRKICLMFDKEGKYNEKVSDLHQNYTINFLTTESPVAVVCKKVDCKSPYLPKFHIFIFSREPWLRMRTNVFLIPRNDRVEPVFLGYWERTWTKVKSSRVLIRQQEGMYHSNFNLNRGWVILSI
jgi:hypothetical protein